MSRQFGAVTRYTFTLNVDFAQLDAQIGCIPSTRNFGPKIPANTTRIADILGPQKSTYSFLDPSTKRTKRWVVTMKDAISKVALPFHLDTPKKCWWCHQSFSDNPLGCPIRLVQKVSTQKYYSHLTKKEMLVDSPDDEEYYLTKGYFCQWGCVLGYAESARHLPEFRESVQLVHRMYHDDVMKTGGPGHDSGESLVKLKANPHFSMLEEYGGPLSLEQYYSTSDTYKPTGNHYIRMVPFGELFELSSKF